MPDNFTTSLSVFRRRLVSEVGLNAFSSAFSAFEQIVAIGTYDTAFLTTTNIKLHYNHFRQLSARTSELAQKGKMFAQDMQRFYALVASGVARSDFKHVETE